MEKTILIDHLHVVLRIPDGLSEEELDGVRRRLSDTGFEEMLLRAVRDVIRTFPELDDVEVSLSR